MYTTLEGVSLIAMIEDAYGVLFWPLIVSYPFFNLSLAEFGGASEQLYMTSNVCIFSRLLPEDLNVGSYTDRLVPSSFRFFSTLADLREVNCTGIHLL